MTIDTFAIPDKPCGDCYRFVGHFDWCITNWVECMCRGSLPYHRYGEVKGCSSANLKRENDPWGGLTPDRPTGTNLDAWDRLRAAA